jgi:regulatory protein
MTTRRRAQDDPRPAPPAVPDGPITSIAPSRRPGRWTVRVGRRRVAVLDQRSVDDLALAIGTPWTADLAARAAHAQHRTAAIDAATRLLRARPRTRAELVDRLRARGFDAAAAHEAADDLAQAGLLNDADAARSLVRAATRRRPAARALLMQRLSRRGVDPGTARAAIDAEQPGLNERDAAARLAYDRARAMDPALPSAVIHRRLSALLARRGFDEDTCREASDRALRRLGRMADDGE